MSLIKQAKQGVFWTFLQQFSVQIINFCVQIVLARMLMPEDFGLIAMLMIFVSIGQSLMDSGLTNSLIRMNKPNQLDYSTIFFANIFFGIIIYFIIYILAPFVANFYNQIILVKILRVFAITFVIRSFVAVHLAKLTKEMDFKKQFKLQVPSTIFSSIVGIIMAFYGFGVWSLVCLNISQAIVFAIQTWFFVNWKPSLLFNTDCFKYHFSFGYKITLSGLLDTIYNDAYRIIIGKFFSPSILGFYNQAETMRLFPVLQISSVLNKVTYPLFSNIKSDIQLKKAYKITMKLSLFIVAPFMLILIIIAKELFLIVFGDKWLPAVPFFQILAFASILRPLGTYNLNILKVKGRSDLFLKVEIIKKSIGFIIIIGIIPFGMMPLIVSAVVIAYISTFINMFFCGRLIKYSFKEQLKDISLIFLLSIISFILTFSINFFLLDKMPSYFSILLLTSLFLLFYFLLVFLFEKEVLVFIKKIL